MTQGIFGGDGDDQITSGDGWAKHKIQGNDGDDLIINGLVGATNQKVYGDDGNDTIQPKITDETLIMTPSTGREELHGGMGNDLIRGSHKNAQ